MVRVGSSALFCRKKLRTLVLFEQSLRLPLDQPCLLGIWPRFLNGLCVTSQASLVAQHCGSEVLSNFIRAAVVRLLPGPPDTSIRRGGTRI
jgi:hypothetical protein